STHPARSPLRRLRHISAKHYCEHTEAKQAQGHPRHTGNFASCAKASNHERLNGIANSANSYAETTQPRPTPRTLRGMICVIIRCDAEYGASCALHLMLLFRRTSSGPSLCSSRADSHAAFDCADKLLKTLLITGSLGLN